MKRRPAELEHQFPNVTFGPGVQVLGMKNIRIGRGACIGQDTWLNVCIRDDLVRMQIGTAVLIGRRGVVNTAGHLEIGDYTITGPNVYIGDADHDYRNIQVPILAGGVTDGRCVVVEENCWLAMNSVVSGYLTVGRGSVIGANSVLTRDVPPFSVVVGNPARIVKMYDPSCKTWLPVRSEKEQQKILANRRRNPLPTREQYRRQLARHGFNGVPPIVAGGENA
jgi:acetyltransferase-like isoleucine patch superfamily enzyme